MRRREGGTRHEWAGPPGTGVPSDIQHPCADWLRHIASMGDRRVSAAGLLAISQSPSWATLTSSGPRRRPIP
jgi:hypothetical protein